MKYVRAHCTVLDLTCLLACGHALAEILRSKLNLKTARLQLKLPTSDFKLATPAVV